MTTAARYAVVVPTKDRPSELSRMLETLARQSPGPTEVVIVDSSATPVESLVTCPRGLTVRFLRHQPPSSAQQRNRGLDELQGDVDLVLFLDDDVVLADDAAAEMLRFFAAAPADVAGASMNFVETGHAGIGRLRRSGLVSATGLYSGTPGDVAPSGWATAIESVTQPTRVRWIPTTGAWWRRAALGAHRFDAFFTGYSYLEDLDFSLTMSDRHTLMIVPSARLDHVPASAGRPGRFAFGRLEVENRLYVVRKHRLSLARCLVALAIRSVMTLGSCLRGDVRSGLARVAGNAVGLASSRGLFGSVARLHLADARGES